MIRKQRNASKDIGSRNRNYDEEQPAPQTTQVHSNPKTVDIQNPNRTPGARLNNFKQIGDRQASKPRIQKQPNNWIAEEQKTEGEGTRLPPIATPSNVSVKSTNAPSIMPRKALAKNSNKKNIRNAIA